MPLGSQKPFVLIRLTSVNQVAFMELWHVLSFGQVCAIFSNAGIVATFGFAGDKTAEDPDVEEGEEELEKVHWAGDWAPV